MRTVHPGRPIGRTECDVILGSRKHGFFKQREQCHNASATATRKLNARQQRMLISVSRMLIKKKTQRNMRSINTQRLADSERRHRQTELGAGRNTAQSRVCAPAAPFSLKICTAKQIINYNKHMCDFNVWLLCAILPVRVCDI